MAHWDSHTYICPCTQMPMDTHNDAGLHVCRSSAGYHLVCLQSFNLSFNSVLSLPLFLTWNLTQTHTHTDTHSSYFNASEGEALSSTAGGHPCKSRKLREHARLLTLPLPRTHTPVQYLHSSKAKHNHDKATAGDTFRLDFQLLPFSKTFLKTQFGRMKGLMINEHQF